ncbi:MAG TPA: hypothetical protein PK344_06380 [Syntrophorhabdaceae bacterium]|nr:hypothetical protein [Syntrophorhabdaceae bacterium]
MQTEESAGDKKKAKSRWPQILGAVAVCIIVSILLAAWWVKSNVYASPFTPTKLTEQEQQVLQEKLDRLGRYVQKERFPAAKPVETTREGRLVPETYSEDASKREIRITERELNGLIAKDEETARRVAIKLSDDMVSVKLLIPVDEDFPILGGKTIRLLCGIVLSYKDGKPVVALRGVSVGGVPIPNAWLGDIKNIDLVQEFGSKGGFWDIFSRGVEDIKVSDGSFYIKLKE